MGLQKVVPRKKITSGRTRSFAGRFLILGKTVSTRNALEANIRAVKCRMGCRTDEDTRWPTKWLEINDTGKVGASEHRAGENTIFYLVPVGLREVALQHVASGRYIAINSKGKLISREVYEAECIFKVIKSFTSG